MFKTKEGIIKPIVYVGIIKERKLLLVDYKIAPNPDKTGWWIPAPGLEFGGDPEETAQNTVREFGFAASSLNLHGVESFVLPGGWHMIYHYIAHVNDEPKPMANVNQYKWVTGEELADMKDMAHGKWEIGVGGSYLK